jgi:hypothetical protein
MGRRYDLDLMILGRVRRNPAAGLKNADAVVELWRASQRTDGSAVLDIRHYGEAVRPAAAIC